MSHSKWRQVAYTTGLVAILVLGAVNISQIGGLGHAGGLALQNATNLASDTSRAAAVSYWGTQTYYPKLSAPPSAAATENPDLGYYPFPSPIACHNNYQSGSYQSLCTVWSQSSGGIISASAPGYGGSYALSRFTGGVAACNPGSSVGSMGTVGNASALVVPPNTPVEIDWACQPKQYTSQYLACGDSWRFYSRDPIYDSAYVTDSQGNTYPSVTWSSTVTQSSVFITANADVKGLIGSTTVTAGPNGTTVTYSLYCHTPGTSWSSGGNELNATVPVTSKVPNPSTSITGNGTNPTTVFVGQDVTIAATYTPGSGDTLTKTAINDYQSNLWCGSTGTCDTSMWTQDPLGNKSYVFTPTATGTYTFYPAMQTFSYPSWNNWGKSLTVTVQAQCPNGTGLAGSCTSCNAGYILSGGNCVAQCPHGQGPAGACTGCDVGYVLSGGNCVAQCPNGTGPAGACTSCNAGFVLSSGNCVAQCPHGTGPSGACTSCNSGYVLIAGSCQQPSITQALQASPTRVRKGGSVALSWGSVGMSSCQLTDMQGTVLSTQLSSSSTTVNNIVSQATFTLTCLDAANNKYTSTASITIQPSFQEI